MNSSTAALFVTFAGFLLEGCMPEQFVSTRYPRWGEEFTLESREDRPGALKLRVLESRYPARAKGCLLLVHGMNEYVGRYREIAEYFSADFHVAGADLFAHGLSNPLIEQADRELARGAAEADVSRAFRSQARLADLGPLRHDFGLALQSLIERCADQPVLIVSHSLGSLVAASYLIEHREERSIAGRIAGIVLLGPAFAVPDIPGWRGWLENPAIRLSFAAESSFLYRGGEPWWIFAPKQLFAVPFALFLRGLFELLSWPGVRNLATPVTPDWVPEYLSDSEEERILHRKDHYIIRRTLLRFAKAVEREIVRFRRRMSAFETPYFLIYSAHDPITAAWGNEDFVRATRPNHPANEVWCLPDQSHHEHLFSSPRLREEILVRIHDWMTQRASGASSARETRMRPPNDDRIGGIRR